MKYKSVAQCSQFFSINPSATSFLGVSRNSLKLALGYLCIDTFLPTWNLWLQNGKVKDYSQSVLEIVHSEEAGSDRFLVLHRLLGKSSKIMSNTCGNCKQNPCLDGKLVTVKNYVENSNVAHIPSPLAVRQSGVKICYAVVKVTHDDDCLLIGHYCPRNSTVTVVPLSSFKYNCKKSA